MAIFVGSNMVVVEVLVAKVSDKIRCGYMVTLDCRYYQPGPSFPQLPDRRLLFPRKYLVNTVAIAVNAVNGKGFIATGK